LHRPRGHRLRWRVDRLVWFVSLDVTFSWFHRNVSILLSNEIVKYCNRLFTPMNGFGGWVGLVRIR
jgi:hypothetical protein